MSGYQRLTDAAYSRKHCLQVSSGNAGEQVIEDSCLVAPDLVKALPAKCTATDQPRALVPRIVDPTQHFPLDETV